MNDLNLRWPAIRLPWKLWFDQMLFFRKPHGQLFSFIRNNIVVNTETRFHGLFTSRFQHHTGRVCIFKSVLILSLFDGKKKKKRRILLFILIVIAYGRTAYYISTVLYNHIIIILYKHVIIIFYTILFSGLNDLLNGFNEHKDDTFNRAECVRTELR